MGKSHRDNHAARKKIGKVAFEKKAARRKEVKKCRGCGTVPREKNLVGDFCTRCTERLSS